MGVRDQNCILLYKSRSGCSADNGMVEAGYTVGD